MLMLDIFIYRLIIKVKSQNLRLSFVSWSSQARAQVRSSSFMQQQSKFASIQSGDRLNDTICTKCTTHKQSDNLHTCLTHFNSWLNLLNY